MKYTKKIIPFILAFAMAFSFLPLASASAPVSILVDNSSVTAWNSLLNSNVKAGVSSSDAQSSYWSKINSALSKVGVGRFDNYSDLVRITAQLDKYGSGVFGSLVEILIDSFTSLWSDPDYILMYDSSLSVYRPYDNHAQIWVVNSLGHFPYYSPDSPPLEGGDTPAIERVGQWRKLKEVGSQSVLWHIATNYELNEYLEMWSSYNPHIFDAGNYYWINYTAQDRTTYVLCDKYGYPYYLPKDKQTAVTTPQNYYQDTTTQYIDDSTTNNYYDYETNEYNQYDNSTNVDVYDGGSALVGSPIDINNGIVNVGGEVQYIDNINYDASTQTYYVDAHDEYVYDTENNYYTTNNFYYLFQYHINYTSVTYIGQTEEYDKRYELYYQLPDGRSSADLTAEDLEQLSVVFADVVPYARSADNVNMRALYHFDGNTEDSSYWSYCTSFDWSAGASLTYMDEGTFDGSLYLDETEHDFTITLPGNDLSSDFTLQFRYYQSYTAAPQLDSYIMCGSEKLFQFDGANYRDGSGTVICATSIGCWNEICLMKKDSVLYFYINGVFCGGVVDNTYHSPAVTFHFGSSQQTYKKIDELRFTKSAIYILNTDYDPTAVPYDTNLSLVLPDGEIPVADEVMIINKSENNLFDSVGLSDWTSSSVISSLDGRALPFYVSSFYPAPKDGIALAYDTDVVSFSDGDFGTVVNFGGNTPQTTMTVSTSSGNKVQYFPYNSLFLPVAYSTSTSYATGNYGYTYRIDYTLSVVLSDGTFSSVTFQWVGTDVIISSSDIHSIVSFSVGHCGVKYDGFNYSSGIFIYPGSGTSAEIVYMELVEGTGPQFTVSWEQAVYSSGELQESPVLAVRTNRTITGYQIGGVRPSYPTKGLVYAMVENSRIISLQQYTGYAWEEVDGRIWTGERWIPYGSFDVFTLQDFYDIIGSSGSEYEYIYTESGFWSWWQKQWISFTSTLGGWFEALISAVGGGGSSSPADDPLLEDEDKEPLEENDYIGIVKLLRETYGFLSDFFTDFTAGGIRNFLGSLTDQNSLVYGIFKIGSIGG